MFNTLLRFFIENSRLNYLLFVLIFSIGIFSYIKTPKEIFPSFELDMISITGSYSGSSVDVLNKMAVKDIESEVVNIVGVDTTTTIISPSAFTIILELEKGSDRYNIANEVKDAVSLTKRFLPSDMNEPIVSVLESKRDLIDISIYSNRVPLSTLKEIADELKASIQAQQNISEVKIFGESDKFYEIILNEQKISAYGLDKNTLLKKLATLSFIYPIGQIEDSKKHFYISTYNGAKSESDFQNIKIKVLDKQIYLKDVASVSKRYEDSSTLFSVNGENAINLSVKQSESGSAMIIVQKINKLLESYQKKYSDVTFITLHDNSERIKDRLNIVISNILLGIILITLLVALLINTRMSIIIAIGIPTSFVIAAIYFYLTGYTINIISLVGVMIALGVVVDDAIVVSEQIQQHVEEGMSPKEAAIKGASEMVKPVTIASITTLFSFIPILMISGTMGEVMKLIPIAFSALIVASLVESFIFLPIHAAHTLKRDSKTLSWERANRFYSLIIHKLLHNKRVFLTLFLILVPLFTAVAIKNSKFQMFPSFDSSSINITIKADVNTKVEDSYAIVKEIERDILKHKKEFYIKDISSIAGSRVDSARNSENFPYVMYITIELEKLKAQNFVDKFITPYLSFYYDEESRIREDKSMKISKELSKFLKQNDYKKRFNLQEISVVERKVGPIKSDIKIGLISDNPLKIMESINKIEDEISKLKGINSIANSASFGVDEIKIKVNPYGEELGLSEGDIGQFLSDLYLSKQKGTAFDDNEMLEIKVESINKDSIENFKNLQIPLESGQSVKLSDVSDFITIESFERLTKENGEINFYIYSNVDSKVITSTEVIDSIQPLLNEIEKDGIKVVLKGEDEKKKDLKSDMLSAVAFALVLILLSMLYLFNSFRDTLIVMSVIPFSVLGAMIGHLFLGLNLSMPSIVGILGLSGVVINDGIIMMTYLKRSKSLEEAYKNASRRFRPIILTSVTTVIGLSTLMFFPTGQAAIFQPMAVSLGFGLAWGTVLNLLYLPVLYSYLNRLSDVKS
ncbi:MAG: efflux RND transporter permease subunit [Campylobacterota bacterium]|nr:efflux RND transporter permease subunit [Campylobacterota bacterium]